MQLDEVIKKLASLKNPEKIKLKAEKFGIHANNAFGIYHQDLKVLAKEIGQDNALALALYDTGIYEARILCSKIYDPACITKKQMEHWVADFESWEICDSFCMGFFTKSKHALAKANEWSQSEQEFVKRAGFAIMAAYGFADKKADNAVFEAFFQPIMREAHDGRIYVKKAINWALRNIGKRNVDLQRSAIVVANQLLMSDSKSAKWIASNALSELKKPNVSILNYPRHLYKPLAKERVH